jgi:hypothetical protein
MTIRVLDPSEWERLLPIYATVNADVPDPDVAHVVVAEDADQIVGMLVLQLIPHLEPLWVAPAHRHTRLWHDLSTAMLATLPAGLTFYTFSSRPAIAKLAARIGMVEQPWTVCEGHS